MVSGAAVLLAACTLADLGGGFGGGHVGGFGAVHEGREVFAPHFGGARRPFINGGSCPYSTTPSFACNN